MQVRIGVRMEVRMEVRGVKRKKERNIFNRNARKGKKENDKIIPV